MNIPRGTTLFHGTLEPFENQDLRAVSFGGERNKILWVAPDSIMAQAYIPTSGSKTGVNERSLLYPTKNPLLIRLQRELDIHYDRLAETEWDHCDRPKSWYPARGWLEGRPLYDRETTQELVRRMETLGYLNEGSQDWPYWWVADDPQGDPRPAHSYREPGRLFILKTQRDLNILDIAEGDLLDLDYHRYGDFAKAVQEGFDGVKINDYAQSVDLGNVGHTAYGLFEHVVADLRWDVIPAIHREMESCFKSWEFVSPEYQEYLEKGACRAV